MKTTLRTLTITLGTLLLVASPALAGWTQNHNETLVRHPAGKRKAR